MKTFVSLLAVVAAANSALAQQFMVNTPTNALQCVTTQISWVATGSGPFFLTIRTPDANGQILQTYDNLASSPFQWSANISANIQLGLTLTDRSSGATALSGPFTLADSGDSSCLNGAAPSAPTDTGSATPSAPGSSGAPAPSSPSAPATGPVTTPSVTAAPTGSATHTSSPSGSRSAGSSSESASPSGAGGSSSGALANTVSVGLVGAVGALAAIFV